MLCTFEVNNSVDVSVDVQNHRCLLNKEWVLFSLLFSMFSLPFAFCGRQHSLWMGFFLPNYITKKIVFFYVHRLDFFNGNGILIYVAFLGIDEKNPGF